MGVVGWCKIQAAAEADEAGRKAQSHSRLPISTFSSPLTNLSKIWQRPIKRETWINPELKSAGCESGYEENNALLVWRHGRACTNSAGQEL
jgi:hypothetical protein